MMRVSYLLLTRRVPSHIHNPLQYMILLLSLQVPKVRYGPRLQPARQPHVRALDTQVFLLTRFQSVQHILPVSERLG